MVGVAQLAEPQVVALVVVGSSPITHPIFTPSGPLAESPQPTGFPTDTPAVQPDGALSAHPTDPRVPPIVFTFKSNQTIS